MSDPSAMKVLLVEDVDSDAEIVRAYLEQASADVFQVVRARGLDEALALLARQKLHAVVLDLFLPDSDELDGLARIRALAPLAPVLILTGRDDAGLALKAVENGAQDYLLKDKINPAMLSRTVNYAIRRKRFESSMIVDARYDRLTRLPNRNLFMERLDLALARQQRMHHEVALMLLDLDGFKSINDTHGHGAGDAVLEEIGRRIPPCLRPYDLAARLGGDEFVVLIEGAASQEAYQSIAEKLIQNLQKPMKIASLQGAVGVSLGMAISGSEESTRLKAHELLLRADKAMYAAKKGNAPRWRIYGATM